MSVEVLKNLPPEQYYGDRTRLSYSILSNYLNTSEAQAVAPFQQTDGMRYGRAFHHVFLNRMLHKSVIVKTYEVDRRSLAGRNLADYLETTHEEYFKNGEQQECDLMCNAFFSSYHQDKEQKEVIDFFRKYGSAEVTIYWLDENGNKFKSRLDMGVFDYDTSTAWVLDLKSDGNLNQEKLYWHYRDMNYDLQMYVYYRALRAAGWKNVKYYTLSCERKTGAYSLNKYGELNSDGFANMAFDEGERKFYLALDKYKCIQEKIKNKIPLSHSLTVGIPLLIHPSYEGQ
jgi:hypothetical protein